MKYIIANENGQYWTGICWSSARPAAEEFEKEELPETVPGRDEQPQELWFHQWGGWVDAGYGKDNFARVEPIRKKGWLT